MVDAGPWTAGSGPPSSVSFLIMIRVHRDEVLPLLGRFVEREDRLDRARRHAGAAVDALVRMNVEHLGRREVRLVLARMDAVDRADVHARRVLRADARFADDVGHRSPPCGAQHAAPLPTQSLRASGRQVPEAHRDVARQLPRVAVLAADNGPVVRAVAETRRRGPLRAPCSHGPARRCRPAAARPFRGRRPQPRTGRSSRRPSPAHRRAQAAQAARAAPRRNRPSSAPASPPVHRAHRRPRRDPSSRRRSPRRRPGSR